MSPFGREYPPHHCQGILGLTRFDGQVAAARRRPPRGYGCPDIQEWRQLANMAGQGYRYQGDRDAGRGTTSLAGCAAGEGRAVAIGRLAWHVEKYIDQYTTGTFTGTTSVVQQHGSLRVLHATGLAPADEFLDDFGCNLTLGLHSRLDECIVWDLKEVRIGRAFRILQ